MVGILVFFSDNPSSNPAKVYLCHDLKLLMNDFGAAFVTSQYLPT